MNYYVFKKSSILTPYLTLVIDVVCDRDCETILAAKIVI
jgi:hypothetical protein